MKDNFTIQAKHFETRTTEDVLHWCITLQDFFEKRTLWRCRGKICHDGTTTERPRQERLHETQENCDQRLCSSQYCYPKRKHRSVSISIQMYQIY